MPTMLEHYGLEGLYQANAVDFDGSSDRLSRGAALTGAADGKEFFFSGWLNADSFASGSNYFYQIRQTGIGAPLQIYFEQTDGNKLYLEGRNSSGTRILLATGSTALSAGTWYHIMISIDLSNSSNRWVRINDTTESMTWDTYTNQNIKLAGDEVEVPHNTAGTFNGGMADIYYDDAFLADTEANRRKLIDAAGKPVSLGTDGSKLTGSAPLVFLSGSTDSWHTNKGTGGGFIETGALTTFPSSPSD